MNLKKTNTIKRVIKQKKYRLQILTTFYGLFVCGMFWVAFSPFPMPAALNNLPEFITSILLKNKSSLDSEISNVFMSAFIALLTLFITFIFESINEIKIRDSRAKMKCKERVSINKKRALARKRSMTDSIVKIQEYFCTIFEAIDPDGQRIAQNNRDERGSISFLKEKNPNDLHVFIRSCQNSTYWCSPSLFYECLCRTESYILWISNYRFSKSDDVIDYCQHELKYTTLRALKSLRDGIDKYGNSYRYPVEIEKLPIKSFGVPFQYDKNKKLLNVKEAVDFVLSQQEFKNKSYDCDDVRKLVEHLYLAIKLCITLSLKIVDEMERKDLELFNVLEEENRMKVWGIV
tara:strand:+ start:1041 stop:2081 length:1041 start_codon:yes stop_codon:yes gene_type:complete